MDRVAWSVRIPILLFCEIPQSLLLTTQMAEWKEMADGLRWQMASEAVDSGLIPSWVKPVTLKLVFTASLLDAQR